MTYAVVLMGVSGAGKDTVFSALNACAGGKMVNIKFSAPMKRMMEYAYDLPPNALEDRDLRTYRIPRHPDDITYGDMMVRCYKHFPAIDPYMMARKVKKQAEESLFIRKPVCFTDIRNHEEVDVVLGLNVPIYLAKVVRPGTVPKDSDLKLPTLLYNLAYTAKYYQRIDNNGDVSKLQAEAVKLYKEIEYYEAIRGVESSFDFDRTTAGKSQAYSSS